MEDSFRLRVDRAFGSLSLPSSSSSSSSLTSLWSLTDDEIVPNPKPKPKPKPKPYSGPTTSSSAVSYGELQKDLEDLDDDDEGPSNPKPDDYDDEQWEIKSCIGLDPTLDFEEEEDQFDKQAIGKENYRDRLYMKDINDDGIDMDSGKVLPNTFRDFVRDPRANHLAAKIRLKQDDEAAKKIDALHVSEQSAPSSDSAGDDMINPKSILKSKDNPSERKSQKRVRFDSECDDRGNDDESEGTRDVRLKISTMEEVTASDESSKSQEFASAVPDYIRNPSGYTHYTLDSSGDMDDESNKHAYMDFLSQLKKSNAANESHGSDALDDDLPSVTFISKKKSGDATMVENEVLSKQKNDVANEFMHRRALTVGIAAADTENRDVCAMEEDEPEVITKDVKKSSQSKRLNRQFRRKAQEELEEPIV